MQSLRNWLIQHGSPGCQKSCQQTCSGVGSSLHGSTGHGRNLLQHRLPMVSQPLLGIPLLWRGVLHGLQVDICSTMDLRGLQGDSLPHHGLLYGLQGKISVLAPEEPLCPPSRLTLVSAEFFLSHIVTPLAEIAVPQQVFLLLKYIITEVLPLSLTGSASASSSSILEAAGIGSTGNG